LAIKIRDLLPRKGVSKFLHRVKKGQHPQELASNATFTKWILTNNSLDYEAKIRTDQSSNQTSTSKLRIRKFPSEIDDQLIEIRQPPGRPYSFLIIRARKRAPTADWKRFLNDNGTLDADRVDEETQSEHEKVMAKEMEKEKRDVDDERPRKNVYADNLKKSW